LEPLEPLFGAGRYNSGGVLPLLEMRGISKAFPGVRALDDVSLTVDAGTVHVLLGQNGAGKSTLMRILCGAHHPDAGEILIDGRTVRLQSPADARRLGVAVIFQEFSLVPYLNLAQNIFLGREPVGRVPGTIDRRKMHGDAKRLLDGLGLDVDTRTPAHELGIAQQQVVEIAKALSQNARILVMDEPTAALSDREIARLFDRVRALKRDGVAIVYISHRLQEIFEIGDRITVLRDGKNVGSFEVSGGPANLGNLIPLMVGRQVTTAYRGRFCETPGEAVLEVRDLRAESGVHASALDVKAGEVVGLAGLVGAGRTELARAIFGADRVVSGTVRVAGAPLGRGPAGAVRAGVALVPENRKTEGLALMRSVQDNVLAAGLRTLFPTGWYRAATAARAAADVIGRLRIATPSPARLVRFLSGGNQQKVVVGKWLTAESRFFIFDEPTRGIDVGAKAELYGVIDRLVADGAAVLMISSELPEVVAVCDRAYVMRDKAIVGELTRADLTEENILRMAMHDA
jgi:ribose transport system ATP-binding protein